MSLQLSDLLEDQKRRIFRDFLKGRQVPDLAKKYDCGEDVIWEVIGLYAKKKHPNDVGNSSLGPADLLVSNLDTGGNATEGPLVARNSRDLRVNHEQVIEEFDYNSPEEKARLAGAETAGIIAEKNRRETIARQEAAKQLIASNTEATDATIDEINKASDEGFVKMKDEAIEKIKTQPSVEDQVRERNEAAESARLAEIGAEVIRQETAAKDAEAATQRQADRADALKQSEADSLEAQTKAREDEARATAEAARKMGLEAIGEARPAATPPAVDVATESDSSSKVVTDKAQEIIDSHPKEHVVPQDVLVKLRASEDKMFEVESVTTTQRPPDSSAPADLTLDTQPPVNPATPEEIAQQDAVHPADSVEAGGQVGQVTVHIQNNTGE
ncbi:MAG TPA: hypothetical protein VIY48_21840 [Candidatus Paceibacterota bacterium]